MKEMDEAEEGEYWAWLQIGEEGEAVFVKETKKGGRIWNNNINFQSLDRILATSLSTILMTKCVICINPQLEKENAALALINSVLILDLEQ